jgi:hypothetical protein
MLPRRARDDARENLASPHPTQSFLPYAHLIKSAHTQRQHFR